MQKKRKTVLAMAFMMTLLSTGVDPAYGSAAWSGKPNHAPV
jgi:hypothetical protein